MGPREREYSKVLEMVGELGVKQCGDLGCGETGNREPPE